MIQTWEVLWGDNKNWTQSQIFQSSPAALSFVNHRCAECFQSLDRWRQRDQIEKEIMSLLWNPTWKHHCYKREALAPETTRAVRVLGSQSRMISCLSKIWFERLRHLQEEQKFNCALVCRPDKNTFLSSQMYRGFFRCRNSYHLRFAQIPSKLLFQEDNSPAVNC